MVRGTTTKPDKLKRRCKPKGVWDTFQGKYYGLNRTRAEHDRCASAPGRLCIPSPILKDSRRAHAKRCFAPATFGAMPKKYTRFLGYPAVNFRPYLVNAWFQLCAGHAEIESAHQWRKPRVFCPLLTAVVAPYLPINMCLPYNLAEKYATHNFAHAGGTGVCSVL